MRIRVIILLIISGMIFQIPVYGKETELNQDSLNGVEKVLREEESDISYTQIVKQLMQGKLKSVLKLIGKELFGKIRNSVMMNYRFLRQIIIVAMIAAVFKNLSDAFFQGSTGKTAFYVTYVIFVGLMSDSFYFLNKTAVNFVEMMIDYMKGMITAYSMAIVSTTGVSTSTAIYEFYLMMIYGISLLTNSVIFPMIRILFVLKIINHISDEEHFSRLCKTLEWGIGLALKSFLSIVLGIQMIQSMLLPAIDSLRNNTLKKGFSVIPGIGGGIATVMSTILGSAVVIKNSIGAAGILILVVLTVPPILQIGGVVISYVAAGVLLQPISDKRITGAIDAIIQSGKLMLRMIITIMVLFILSIVIIAFSTNVNYYTG